MPTIFDIDFSQQAPELLPPDKWDDNMFSLTRALLKSVQWCRDLLFTSYKTGATAPNYAAGTYNQYDTVIYRKAVYYSLIPGNTDAPTVITSWLKIQDNFLGVDQRVLFNGQALVLEYALNQQFGGTFRPPGSSSKSDIYLTNIAGTFAGFIVGKTEPYSSSVGQTTSADFIGLAYPIVHLNNFQINFLASLFALTTDSGVRNFANLYVPTSLNYIIVTY